MTVHEWLDVNDGQNLKRLAELMTVNHGKMEVTDVGQPINAPDSRYGRVVLNVNEAFELTYYKGVIDGLTNAHGNAQILSQQVMNRLVREATGQVIDIPTPEQRKALLGGK